MAEDSAGAVKRALARAARRSVAATCLWYLLDDWRARRRLARGDLSTRSGARHAGFDPDRSLAYIERVHGDYLAYGGRARLTGAVAEIGPGDNFGVALLLRSGGAETVHAVDRYVSRRDPDRQTVIYETLAERHGLDALFDGPPGEATIRGVVHHTGMPAERFFRESGLRFDAILSRAVMEHLYDPLGGLDDMAAALDPGGIMIHRIDMRDHGMFAGRHPLTFLTVPDAIHHRMTRHAGRPNRVLMPRWRDWLAGSGLTGHVKITRLAGVDGEIAPAAWAEIDPARRETALATVRAIRPRLARSLRGLSDEDLAVAGCVLVAQKPAAHASTRMSDKAAATRASS